MFLVHLCFKNQRHPAPFLPWYYSLSLFLFCFLKSTFSACIMMCQWGINHQLIGHYWSNHTTVVVVKESKLLGAIITSYLKWGRNTNHIVRNANKMMKSPHIVSKFTRNCNCYLTTLIWQMLFIEIVVGYATESKRVVELLEV